MTTARTVKEVFSFIEQNSNFVFLYSKDVQSDLEKKVSMNVNGKKAEEILKELSSIAGLNFKINNRQITVARKAVAEPQPKAVNQDIRVTGQVFDDMGETVPGANVTLKGNSSVGTVTDIDGNFTLNVPKGSTLVVSFIGYAPYEWVVNDTEKKVIKLAPDSQALDEVVVVAYGTQKKSSITGSISTVKSESLKTVTTPSVESMLGGKIAGAVVTQTDGKPGGSTNITIRGRGSISSTTTPLWVIDGVVGGQASELNPNDIESISVLKDGSATALYGSRGANGVILVTTKSAKLGMNKIDISVKVGATQATKGGFKVMNSKELYEYTEAAFRNSTTGEAYSWFTPKLLENDTDWWDIATQTAFSQNYNVAYTTGTDKIKSYLSADYYSEEGTVKGYDYDRFTARSNINYKFNDRLTIRTKVSASYSKSFSQERSLYASLTYLPWNRTFNDVHDVIAFAGFEYNDQYTKTNSATGEGIPVGGEVLGVATSPASVDGDQYTWKAIGYYFNANYSYKDTYMLQFSFRHDGSSKFGRDKRFGNFYTIGAGWNLQNEPFIQKLDFISRMKLRASFGSTGNTPGSAFSHMGL